MASLKWPLPFPSAKNRQFLGDLCDLCGKELIALWSITQLQRASAGDGVEIRSEYGIRRRLGKAGSHFKSIIHQRCLSMFGLLFFRIS